MCRWEVHWKEYKMNGSISVHILTSFSWECGNLTRLWLSHGRWKKPPAIISYLRARWLVQSLARRFSKRLLNTHTLNLQEFGDSSISTGRWQIHCAAALGTLHLILSGGLLLWQDSQNNTALPRPDSTLQGCWPIFTCVYSNPHHMGKGEFKPSI